jgi:hypothetical protein
MHDELVRPEAGEHTERRGADRAGRDAKGVEVAVLLAIAAIAVVHLAYPFASDQAFSTVMGRAIGRGDVLYRDVWDVRQPGIYLFFWAGGSLFGFKEFGAHLLEGIYFLAFAVVMQRTLRDHFEHAWLAAATPLFTIAPYWAAATKSELTATEALIGFPLFVACFALGDVRREEPSRRRCVVAGLAGAAVAFFKLIYLPIVAVVWAIAFFDIAKRVGVRAMFRPLRWLLLAFFAPVLLAFAYFAAAGALYEVYWTFVVFPPKQRALDMRDFDRLAVSLRYLARYFGWALPLVVLGVLGNRRWRSRAVQVLLVWLLLGAVLVLAQTWGPYQFQVLIVPIGLLAAFGADRLATLLRTAPPGARLTAARAVAVIVAVLVLLPARPLVATTLRFAQNDFTLTASGRAAFQARFSDGYYPIAQRSSAFLRTPGSRPGPVLVIGQAELQYFSGRDLAGPVSGQTPEQLDSRLWRKIREELRDVRPPYVFFADDYHDLIRERSPETRDQIARDYCRFRRAPDGWWLARRAGGDCS